MHHHLVAIATPTRRGALRRAAVVLSLVAMATGGCATGAPSPSATSHPFAASQLEQAREFGADPAQIHVLESAADTGVVTYEDANSLMGGFEECLASAGLTLLLVEDEVVGPGVRLPGYSMALTNPNLGEDQAAAIAYECEERHVLYAYTVGRNSAVAREAIDTVWESQRDTSAACLGDLGYSATPDLTIAELQALETEAFIDTQVTCGP